MTYEDISKTLYNMKNEKSSGISGFAADFFKVFWKDIGPFVLRSLNYGYMKGELSISEKQGVISCIQKENKPKLYLKKNGDSLPSLTQFIKLHQLLFQTDKTKSRQSHR